MLSCSACILLAFLLCEYSWPSAAALLCPTPLPAYAKENIYTGSVAKISLFETLPDLLPLDYKALKWRHKTLAFLSLDVHRADFTIGCT